GVLSNVTYYPAVITGWYADGAVKFNMTGAEQKYMAPGGGEPLAVSFNPSEIEGQLQGKYDYTYDKVVSGMNMRYRIVIEFKKQQ
ncbi:MAG: hypothetical protein Q8882_02125, partial [Bacillota bacterium]|nr:hypothetical protein [Bacillota bacterium]